MVTLVVTKQVLGGVIHNALESHSRRVSSTHAKTKRMKPMATMEPRRRERCGDAMRCNEKKPLTLAGETAKTPKNQMKTD